MCHVGCIHNIWHAYLCSVQNRYHNWPQSPKVTRWRGVLSPIHCEPVQCICHIKCSELSAMTLLVALLDKQEEWLGLPYFSISKHGQARSLSSLWAGWVPGWSYTASAMLPPHFQPALPGPPATFTDGQHCAEGGTALSLLRGRHQAPPPSAMQPWKEEAMCPLAAMEATGRAISSSVLAGRSRKIWNFYWAGQDFFLAIQIWDKPSFLGREGGECGANSADRPFTSPSCLTGQLALSADPWKKMYTHLHSQIRFAFKCVLKRHIFNLFQPKQLWETPRLDQVYG